jgi:hypothetical protein
MVAAPWRRRQARHGMNRRQGTGTPVRTGRPARALPRDASHALGPRVVALGALGIALAGVLATAVGVESRGDRGAARLVPVLDARDYPPLTPVHQVAAAGWRAAQDGPGLRTAATGEGALPPPGRVAAAQRWISRRQGRVAFAVADGRGRIKGVDAYRPFASASLVKAMLLVAYLDGLERAGEQLRPEARSRLDAMVRSSDNDAANTIFRDVGPTGLSELAARARMEAFAAGPAWGASRVTAADQARFFRSLDRLLPPRYRELAWTLLARIAPEQSWGIPAVARPHWRVFFKGGWRPEPSGNVVHQAALLENGSEKLSLAVLSDANPSHEYGIETIRGVAQVLLGRPPRRPATRRPFGRLVPVRALPANRPAAPRRLLPLARRAG